MKVVIEIPVFARAPERFDEAARRHGIEWIRIAPLDEAAALAAHRDRGADVFIIGTKRYSDVFFSALRPGSLIQRYGVGVDSVPADLCRRGGLRIGYTPGTLETSVAEHAIGLMCALARSICRHDRETRAGAWRGAGGVELRGRTLALIGFGRIARATAAIARNGFGMRIAAFDLPAALGEPAAALADACFTDLPACLRGADVVSLHLPDTPATRGIVNEAFLSAMKPSAFLINTARGPLVDEAALHRALTEGRIAGAALDVFGREPYEPAGPDLREVETCILTPHVASNTSAASERMADVCVANCVAHAAGKIDDLILAPGSR